MLLFVVVVEGRPGQAASLRSCWLALNLAMDSSFPVCYHLSNVARQNNFNFNMGVYKLKMIAQKEKCFFFNV